MDYFNLGVHSKPISTLSVGEKMLEGELEYHKGNHHLAFAALRKSVLRDDNLEYTEPWAWMHPPRHALAALLTSSCLCRMQTVAVPPSNCCSYQS